MSGVLDWNGNICIQTSYAGAGFKDTMQVGFLNAGVGVGIALTDVETVQDLLEYGGNVGFGMGIYGFDLTTTNFGGDDFNGFRFSVGVDPSIDIHVAKTFTENMALWNIYDLLFFIIGRKNYGNVYASRCFAAD